MRPHAATLGDCFADHFAWECACALLYLDDESPRALDYTALVSAPSMMRLVPDTRLATGLARNTTPAATSCAVPIRPVGLSAIADLNRSGMPRSMFCQIPPSK